MMLAIALLAASATPSPAPDTWLQCAFAAIESRLDAGIPASWRKADAVPEHAALRLLGAQPAAGAIDAFHYVLHALPGEHVVYVARSGGIADFRVVYGPITVPECEMAASVAAR